MGPSRTSRRAAGGVFLATAADTQQLLVYELLQIAIASPQADYWCLDRGLLNLPPAQQLDKQQIRTLLQLAVTHTQGHYRGVEIPTKLLELPAAGQMTDKEVVQLLQEGLLELFNLDPEEDIDYGGVWRLLQARTGADRCLEKTAHELLLMAAAEQQSCMNGMWALEVLLLKESFQVLLTLDLVHQLLLKLVKERQRYTRNLLEGDLGEKLQDIMARNPDQANELLVAAARGHISRPSHSVLPLLLGLLTPLLPLQTATAATAAVGDGPAAAVEATGVGHGAAAGVEAGGVGHGAAAGVEAGGVGDDPTGAGVGGATRAAGTWVVYRHDPHPAAGGH
jgi:hypothetical protein